MSERHRLPAERNGITHKFTVGDQKGYITVGLYPDGSPGEVFVRIAKEGSTLSGVLDSFAIMVSLALQHGIPLRTLVDKFKHVHFEPFGKTGNPEIPFADSLIDYLFRWLETTYCAKEADAPKIEV